MPLGANIVPAAIEEMYFIARGHLILFDLAAVARETLHAGQVADQRQAKPESESNSELVVREHQAPV